MAVNSNACTRQTWNLGVTVKGFGLICDEADSQVWALLFQLQKKLRYLCTHTTAKLDIHKNKNHVQM
jgi:hypothetical protein